MIGYIDSVEVMGLVDGPGIRFVTFLTGCKLRCSFCHNPEMWQKTGLEITSEELLRRILKYKNYYIDGGVTFSGGEPLMQSDFLIEILKKCQMCGLHTALDTAGVGGNKHEEILKYTDLVIYDIKALDSENYKKITGYEIDESLSFLNKCQEMNKKMWLRQVIIPGINDNEEYILKLKNFIKKLKNIEKVELLPYHTMQLEKYKKLNIIYPLIGVEDMDKNKCKKLEELLNKDLF